MNLEMALDFERTAEEVEAGGGVNQPGWYKATVETVEASGRFEGALLFRFLVTSGTYKGAKLTETLYDPSFAEDVDKADKMKQRLHLFASRLGLWDGQAGRQTVRWPDAVGREVVLEVTGQSWKDATTGEQRSKVGISYGGIYPPDHPKIPETQRKALSLPPARPKDAKPDQPGQGTLPGTSPPQGKPGAKNIDYGSL